MYGKNARSLIPELGVTVRSFGTVFDTLLSYRNIHMRIRKQRGFSAVELVTVCAIVTVGLATTLPAVMQARDQARSLACKNNLKQIGLALHNYHDTYGTFAPGWTSNHDKPGVQAELGWQTSLLPFIEQAPLFNQLNFNLPMQPAPELQQSLAVYRCPADRAPSSNPLRGDFGTSNYTGNYGDRPFRRWLPGRFSQFWPGQADSPMGMDKTGFISGVFWRNSSSRIRDMLDGTSNTLMVSERSFEFGAGIWPGVGGHEMETDQISDGSFISPLNKSLTGFSSSHGGGVNVMLGDGSVRFIADTVESSTTPDGPLGVLQKLCNRRDGENVNF